MFGLTLWQSLRAGRMWSHSLFHVILRDGKWPKSSSIRSNTDVMLLLFPRNGVLRVRRYAKPCICASKTDARNVGISLTFSIRHIRQGARHLLHVKYPDICGICLTLLSLVLSVDVGASRVVTVARAGTSPKTSNICLINILTHGPISANSQSIKAL